MKKLLFLTFAILLVCAGLALAQGDPELFGNGKMEVGGNMATASVTKYSQAAGATKVTIPLAKTVSKFCLQPTAASGVRLGTSAGFSGDQKLIAAAGEWCRGVRKGVTQLQYSSAPTGTATLERQY